MFKRILVPLDGSDTAEAILPFAQEIAAKNSAELLLVTAVDQVGAWDAALTLDVLDKEEVVAQEYLKGHVAKLPGSRSKVVRGDAATAILKTAGDEKADLIAISTHGRSGITRFLFGSVATKILEGADVPVLFLRPKEGEDKGAPGPVVMKILVPLDGSDVALSVLPPVEAFAKAMGASLVLFHAVQPITSYPGFEMGAGAAIPTIVGELQEQAKQFLARTAEEVRARGIEVTTAIALDTPVNGVLRAGDDLKVDLIAIGTHGRGGLGRAILGSTADNVVRRCADLPCLVIRAKE